MNSLSWALLALTAALAVVDWWAVANSRRSVELVCKPATLVALIAVALALDPADDAMRTWFVVALVFSLGGDVFLMLDRFVPGLVSFLLGHIAYVVGFWVGGVDAAGIILGVVLVGLAVGFIARPIVAGVHSSPERELKGPVIAYIGVISAMVISAFGYGSVLAIAGSISFYASDALIAWNRFIQEYPWGRVAIMVTYHLGQIALVLSLV